MGRPSMKPAMWTIGQILEYADRYYKKNGWFLSEKSDYSNFYQQIRRRLQDLNLLDNQQKGENITVAEPIAKFLVEDYWKEDFSSVKPFEKRIQEKFANQDSALTEHELNVLSFSVENGDLDLGKTQKIIEQAEIEKEGLSNNVNANRSSGCDTLLTKRLEELDEIISSGQRLLSQFDEFGIHKNAYEYHINITDDAEYILEKSDEIIDRVMLRELFHLFFTFDEERFRKDLIAWGNTFTTGLGATEYSGKYSEYKEKLEHPLGKYIFLKKDFGKGIK